MHDRYETFASPLPSIDIIGTGRSLGQQIFGRRMPFLPGVTDYDLAYVAYTNKANLFTASPQTIAGTLIVRQPGGTPGSKELQISHDGTNILFINEVTPCTTTFYSTGKMLLNVTSTFNATACDYQTGSAGRGMFSSSGSTVALAANSFALFQVDGGAGLSCTMPSDIILGWASATHTSTVSSTPDAYFSRLAAGVVGVNSWIRNTGGEAALASAFTNSNGTLANTNLSHTVIAGRSYRIEGYLIVSNTNAADGFQCDFNGGAATATTFDVGAGVISSGGTVIAGTTGGSLLSTALQFSTVTGTCRLMIGGYLKCNAAGTVIMRAATNSTVSGTMTLAAGSWLAFYDTVNL